MMTMLMKIQLSRTMVGVMLFIYDDFKPMMMRQLFNRNHFKINTGKRVKGCRMITGHSTFENASM